LRQSQTVARFAQLHAGIEFLGGHRPSPGALRSGR
jgi:hypothetical protein